MFDRRKFFKLFAAGAAGLTVAGKMALAEDIQNWMLSPQKTIFIPPPQKIEVVQPMMFNYVIKYSDGAPWEVEASWVQLPHPDERTRLFVEQQALKAFVEPGTVRVDELVPGDFKLL